MSQNFNQPEFPNPPIVVLGGTEYVLGTIPGGYQLDKADAAAFLGMESGKVRVQLPHRQSSDPLRGSSNVWSFTYRKDNETDWNIISRAQASARAIYWIPYGTEMESFIMASGDNTKTLSRPLAESIATTNFDAVNYVSVAWLDGVSQTIISSGTPASGEVKIVGSTVDVTGMSGGEYLEIRYYPAYIAFIGELSEEYQRFNQNDVAVAVLETSGVTP